MGFHTYSSPYDWSRIAGYKATANAVEGGMIDLSVGSPVDSVPDAVQQALASTATNMHESPWEPFLGRYVPKIRRTLGLLRPRACIT